MLGIGSFILALAFRLGMYRKASRLLDGRDQPANPMPVDSRSPLQGA